MPHVPDLDPLLTVQQLADLCQLPVASVYEMNSAGTAPRRLHIAGRCRYRESDVTAWLAESEVKKGQ
jgi:predicted DNA-binding transcriptional regulator AlpA